MYYIQHIRTGEIKLFADEYDAADYIKKNDLKDVWFEPELLQIQIKGRD